jgi:hypothetical protein
VFHVKPQITANYGPRPRRRCSDGVTVPENAHPFRSTMSKTRRREDRRPTGPHGNESLSRGFGAENDSDPFSLFSLWYCVP